MIRVRMEMWIGGEERRGDRHIFQSKCDSRHQSQRHSPARPLCLNLPGPAIDTSTVALVSSTPTVMSMCGSAIDTLPFIVLLWHIQY